MLKRTWLSIVALMLLSVVILSGCGKKEEFLIGVIPAQNEGNLKLAIEKLGKVMTNKLQRNVRVEVYPDYNGVVEAMGANKIQMAYLGPLTYVEAHEKYGAKAVVTEKINGVPYYYSYMITHADSPYASMEDVVNNSAKISFAFGDINSTSGSLIPGIALKKAGVFESQQKNKFKKVTYTGGHDATALAIQNKSVDVGAIDSAIYATLVKSGKVDGNKIKTIWKSEELYQYPWAVAKNISDADAAKIQETMVGIKDAEILSAFSGATEFIPAKNEDYTAIRQAALEDGRLK